MVSTPIDKTGSADFSARLRLVTDIAGLVAAIPCLLLALWFHSWTFLFLNQSVAILCALAALAMFSSIVVSAIARWSSVPGYQASPSAARIGARIGSIIILAGGGFFVLVASLHHSGIGLDVTIALHPVRVLMVVALSSIPVVFAASLSCVLITGLQISRQPDVLTVAGESGEEDFVPRRRFSLLPWIIGLSILCLMSPTILLLPRGEEESSEAVVLDPTDGAANSITIDPENTSVPKPPPKPEFRYSQPTNFYNAPPAYWKIAFRKIIPEFDMSRPVAMSPNGQFLAYFSTQDVGSLIVFDLNLFKVYATFPGFDQIISTAWSPQSNRLFCFTASDRPNVFVLKMNGKRKIALPLPKNALIPHTQPFWWNPLEIAFFPTNGEHLSINLSELRLQPIDESAQWRERVKKSTNSSQPIPTLELIQSSRCRFTIAPAITSYLSPGFQQADWAIEWQAVMSIHDKVDPHLRCFPSLEIADGDLIATVSDRMKLIRIRNGMAEVTYFTLEKRPEPFYRISTPSGLKTENADDFENHLKSQTLCAFISAPLIHPLTDKVIGPNREAVKAIARVIAWKDGEAVLWLAEEYFPVNAGDILADFHVWKNGKPASILSPLPDRWWTPILAPEESADDPDLPKDMVPIDRQSGFDLDSEKGTLRVARFVYPKVSTVGTSAESSGSASDPKKIIKPKKVDLSREGRIRTFILEHYKKLSLKDFDGFLADYTDYVVYYGEANAKQKNVRQDVLSMRSLRKIDAVVKGKIKLAANPADRTRFTAIYDLEFKAETASGEKYESKATIELGVFFTSKAILIVAEGNAGDSGNVRQLKKFIPSSGASSPLQIAPEIKGKIIAFLNQHVRDMAGRNSEALLDNYVDNLDRDAPDPISSKSMRQKMTNPKFGWPESITVTDRMDIGRVPGYSNRYKASYPIKVIDVGRTFHYLVHINVVMTRNEPLIYSEGNSAIPAKRKN